jgi:erythromycin esterase-like protein
MPSAARIAPPPDPQPIVGASGDYDKLLDLIGGSNLVLIGEASHGTHEFYRERARITRRLVEDGGFRAVAVEADRPDAYRVNRYRPRSGARRAARDLSDRFMSGLKIDSPGRSTRIASMVSKWSSVVSDSRGPWQ